MAILGGIFGSLVDYDMGGVRSNAEIDRDLLRRQQRIDMETAARDARDHADEVAALRGELARANRRLGISEASLNATIDQRKLLIDALKQVDPNNPLLRPTGELNANGQPRTLIGAFWGNFFTKYIKEKFGEDAHPADYHSDFKR